MEPAIDLRELPKNEVKLVQEFVEFLKQKARSKKARGGKKRTKRVALAARRSDVIGSLTRREIYEDV